jgi:hypothetical protein
MNHLCFIGLTASPLLCQVFILFKDTFCFTAFNLIQQFTAVLMLIYFYGFTLSKIFDNNPLYQNFKYINNHLLLNINSLILEKNIIK